MSDDHPHDPIAALNALSGSIEALSRALAARAAPSG
jgi:hypothetical protein